MQGKNPFSELRDVINSMENRVDELAKAYGVEHLAGPQGFTVMYLWKHQNQEVFIKDIEKCLHISKSVASNLIKRMEKNGFIDIVPSTVDKRYKQVVLTELGLEKAQKTHDFHEVIHSQILEGISQEEFVLAKEVFLKLKKNLEKGVNDV